MSPKSLDGRGPGQTQYLPASVPEGDGGKPEKVMASGGRGIVGIENPNDEGARAELPGELVEVRGEKGARAAPLALEGDHERPGISQQAVEVAGLDSQRRDEPTSHMNLPEEPGLLRDGANKVPRGAIALTREQGSLRMH